jgi:hypothetical protein
MLQGFWDSLWQDLIIPLFDPDRLLFVFKFLVLGKLWNFHIKPVLNLDE